VLAIGVWSDVGSPGLARVYESDGSSWAQRGGDIDGEANGGQDFGYAIAMSGDGSVLAIGDPRNNNEMGFEAGLVRVYSWDGASYAQRGENLKEVSNDVRFGTSLSLSASGDVLVVGAPLDINGGGAVFVYEWDDASSLWSWGLGTASQSPSAIYGKYRAIIAGPRWTSRPRAP
jgi:hypothetical protein